MRICEKCDTEYEEGRFCMQCGSDLKEKKTGEGMFDHTPDELETIDRSLEPRLVRAQTRAAEAEQMALDATRLLSCTEDRLGDYAEQGFFKRCWHKLCGKQGEMQRANQKDLIEMQKYAWRYLELLQERDLLLAHSVITVKNNLMTLAVEQEKTKNAINRMAEKVYKRFVALENRVGVLEVATNIHSWLLTIETYDYDEKFPPHFRLLRVVRDFLALKEDDWNITEIKYLQKAVKEAGLPWKKKIRLADFVCELTDEIEDSSFSQYQELLRLYFGEPGNPIPASFILENVSVPSFTSLYQIADSYTGSSAVIDVLSEELNISRKEAIRKVLTTFIRKQGIDLDVSIPLRDLAVELLNCMKLTKKLFESLNNEQNFQQPQEKEESDFASASADSDIPEEEKTFKWYLKAAEQGDAKAQFILGKKYSDGDEVKADQQKAFKWYSKAAEQGHAKAQFELGEVYSEKDDKKNAFEWYSKAADQGLAEAQCALGGMYYFKKDDRKAFKWLSKAADQGLAEAQCALSMYYLDKKDVRKAFEWLSKAADQDFALAITMIGAFYNLGIYVDKNEKQAFRYYMKSAEQNDDCGQCLVGQCYYYGEGVEKDNFEALKWYKRALNNNSITAIIRVARYYYCEEKNIDLAKSYLKEAIEKGNLTAMAIYSFIEDTKGFSSSEANLGYGDYGRAAGDLWIVGDNMGCKNYGKLENAKQAYAGNLANRAQLLWDATIFGSAKEGFLITKDLDIISHRDTFPRSLLNGNPRSVIAKMKYFEGKDSRMINAIVRLAELAKKGKKGKKGLDYRFDNFLFTA
ncbi:tetratricopeptide repeat protein [Desulfobacterales bacterium HSG2]|nr:tetratricopeptide repeat protein [Desulfobacterales bacterium HSG2]